MKALLIATVALLSIGSASAAPLDQAVKSLYRANDTVQRAIDRDVCQNRDTLYDDATARKALSTRDVKRYDRIRDRLMKAYASTNQTDGALEQMNADFCEVVSNR